jgi:monoamine oxidase
MYDLTVVGGGISGLYSIYKYIKMISSNDLKMKKILLLERSSRIGGRIYTIKNKSQLYESGGARFSNQHHLLVELIKEFKLDNKMYPLHAERVYISEKNPNNPVKINDQLDKILDKIIALIKKNKLSEEYLLSKTFYDIVFEISPNLCKQFISMYPYYSEVFIMNARDALISLERDFTSKSQYYILQGGLEQIIRKLVNTLKKYGVDIHLESSVNNIYKSKIGDEFEVETENFKKYKTKELILAIPPKNLLQIPFIKEQRLYSILNLVTYQPLFRIYAKYKKSWIPHHIVTDSLLNYIIPYNNDGLIMISYTDGPKTKEWYDYYLESEEKLIEMLHIKLKEILPNIEIPELEWIDVKSYWDIGCHYWKPRKTYIDHDKLENKIRHPMKNMWIIGEAFSNYQAWVEGALLTADKAINDMIRIQNNQNNMIGGKKITKYTMNDVSQHNKKNDAWLVINNKVYDVTKWIPHHPGGMVIMKGIGKDATDLFNKVGHDLYAKNKLKEFEIGVLDV